MLLSHYECVLISEEEETQSTKSVNPTISQERTAVVAGQSEIVAEQPGPTLALSRTPSASTDLKPALMAVPHFESLPAPKSQAERNLREANEHLRENIARKEIRAYEMADRGLKVHLTPSDHWPYSLAGVDQSASLDLPNIAGRCEQLCLLSRVRHHSERAQCCPDQEPHRVLLANADCASNR